MPSPGAAPGRQSTYAFAGMNVLIQFGPISARAPSAPDMTRQQAAAAIVAALDPLLWPLLQRSVLPIPSRTPVPVATAVPSASAAPAKTPRPSKKPWTSPRRTGGRSGEEVSDLDKRIIEHLQEDGRRPFTQIADDLGVSEAAVRARTNRLVERGILQIVGVTIR